MILVVLTGCSSENEEQPEEFVWTKKQSTDFNRLRAEDEERDIDMYLEMRPEWKVERTGSGLRIWIYEEGEGESPVPGDIAEIEYVVELLDGKECYRTNDDEYEEVVVDKSELETGVQEALKMMKPGDRAKLIVPSHIAHGLLGDLNKIPPMRSLVIDLKLLGVKK